MKLSLLDFIVCPSCHSPLNLEGVQQSVPGNGEVDSGTLACGACYRLYPIIRGIPRLITDIAAIQEKTSRAFRDQWVRFPDLMHEKNKIELISYLQPLTPEVLEGKVVLDAGCGIGKFSYWTAQYGAAQIMAVDLSDSVEVAYRHTCHLPNVHVLQADIYRLPFKQQFDFIYSIGVLHHLPDPEQGFRNLVKLLKPGGTIFVWVYAKEGNWLHITLADPIRKWVTSRLPLPLNAFIARVLSGVLWATIKLVYVPLNSVSLTRKLGHLLPFNSYFLYWNDLGFHMFEVTVYDKMIPPICVYLNRDEFAQWFTNASLSNVQISLRNGNSWRGYGSTRLPKPGKVAE